MKKGLILFSVETIYFVYCSGFAFFFAMMTTIFALYHLQTVGMNPFQLVLVGTVLEATCFVLEIPTGVVADRYSRKGSLVIGLLIMGLGILLEGLFPVFLIVLLAQIVWGGGATFLSGADTAWLNDELRGVNLDRTLLKGAQFRQGFTFLGILLTIPLASFSLSTPIVVCGAGLVVLALFLFGYMPENHYQPSHTPGQGLLSGMAGTARTGLGMVARSRGLIMLFGATLFGGLYNEGFDRLWTVHVLDDVGIPGWFHLSEVTWFALIAMAAALLGALALKGAEKKVHEGDGGVNRALIIIHLALFGSVLGFALGKAFWLVLLFYLFSRSFRTVLSPLFDLQINREITDSSQRATILSMRGQLDQLGQIVGGPVLGFLAARFSVPFGLTMAALLLLPSIPLLLRSRSGR